MYVTESSFVHNGYDENHFEATGIKRWYSPTSPDGYTYQEPGKSVVLCPSQIQKMRERREISVRPESFEYMFDDAHYEKTGKKV